MLNETRMCWCFIDYWIEKCAVKHWKTFTEYLGWCGFVVFWNIMWHIGYIRALAWWYQGSCPEGWSGWGVKLTTYLRVARLSMCGAINITCMGTTFPLLLHGKLNPIFCPQMSVHIQKNSLFNFQFGFKKRCFVLKVL